MKKLIVIGGGAAGLLCAYYAARGGISVLILDKNARPGRKLMITGKGRCNITNDCDIRRFMESVATNRSFLYSALNFLPPSALIELMEENGLPLKTERGSRVFPQSDKAVDVVDTLIRMVRAAGCKYMQAEVASLIIDAGKAVGVRTAENKVIGADAVVVATGGASYTRTGSTGDGYAFARQAGHTVITPRPSLVPLVTKSDTARRLMGLSLKNAAITVTREGAADPVYKDFGELLFTHFGLSGPVILSASAHMTEKGRYTVLIDLKPALTAEELSKRILRDFAALPNRDFANSLDGLLPKKLIPVIVELSGISPHKKANSVTKEERLALVGLLKSMSFTVTGTRPIEEAIVTGGGVAVGEIDPKTMMSKKTANLYFAGEVIDVDAFTGGFNIHIAMATGALAGNSAAEALCGGK